MLAEAIRDARLGDPAARERVRAATPAVARLEGLRLLVVEDNPVNLMVLECMLETCPGLIVECIVSPEEGLARALAEPPDLVLLDIQMPVLNGYQVLERLRAHPATRRVPVIAVSADAMPQSLARGRAAGFNDYLTKPLELPTLRASLRVALPDADLGA
jgi:CheY-like chemotaxis protein